MRQRIHSKELHRLTAAVEQAAELIKKDMTVAMGGYAMAGYPKAIPAELVRRAQSGEDIRLNLITGANLPVLDEQLAAAGIIARRVPMCAGKTLAGQINRAEAHYVEQQMAKLPRLLRSGRLGAVDIAVVEALEIREEGIIPTTSVGMDQHLLDAAQKVIVEINLAQPSELNGLHDCYTPAAPPHTKPIPLTEAGGRIGTRFLKVPREKIAAIVESRIPERLAGPAPPTAVSGAIAGHLFNFLELEYKNGMGASSLPPIQTGFGGISDGLAHAFKSSAFNRLQFFCGGIGEAVVSLALAGKADVLSAGGLGITDFVEQALQKNTRLRDILILRSGDVTNSAETVSRLGLLALNTGIEADIYGNVNSSHIAGSKVVNGIGGGANFAQNAGLSVVLLASTGKAGAISNIVPMVSHQDICEHDVDVLVTEHGLADLRGLDETERARAVIENCTAGAYREQLRRYLKRAEKAGGHHPQLPVEAFDWYVRLKENGTMLEE